MINPDKNQTEIIKDVYPGTRILLSKNKNRLYMAKIKARHEIIKPNLTVSLNGLSEKEIMMSIANLSSFLNE